MCDEPVKTTMSSKPSHVFANADVSARGGTRTMSRRAVRDDVVMESRTTANRRQQVFLPMNPRRQRPFDLSMIFVPAIVVVLGARS